MLWYVILKNRGSDRKLRLFAVACCRRVWHLIKRKGWQNVLELTEQYAEGAVKKKDVAKASSKAAEYYAVRIAESARWASEAVDASNGNRECIYQVPYEAARAAAFAVEKSESSAKWKHSLDAELLVQASLLRCVLGYTFRSADAPDPAWLRWNGGTVVKLAGDAYEHRSLPDGTLDPVLVGLLADALEEAGCTDADLLGHLRGPGPHVRGCWAVDLVLGKR
jgi:hypothetical protein